MQFSSRLTVATHILLCIAEFSNDYKVTSSFLADSTNVNPVNIRKTLGQLKDAGLIKIEAGVGGASFIKDPNEITLLTIFQAVEKEDEELFHFHKKPNPKCPVGSTIHEVLDDRLDKIKHQMEIQMASTTLQTLIYDMKIKIDQKKNVEDSLN